MGATGATLIVEGASRLDVAQAHAAALCPVFQPIVDLQTGEMVGVEALARFHVDGTAYQPRAVLPHLSVDERLGLFTHMVRHALALRREPWWPGGFVSINAEVGLIVADGFPDIVAHLLDAEGQADHLVIEMLEDQRIEDPGRMAGALRRLRDLGVRVALDDVGSGYSSLLNLRQLPVDILKLDRDFTVDLCRKPGDLAYIFMVANLARALGKQLIVEGVERADILDALTILGIECAQGYAVAHPMDAAALPAWLAGREKLTAHRMPQSLLGAYASHLTVVETCQMLDLQPLEMEWKEQARDWRGCMIGRFFEKADLHDTPCGDAHRHFHTVIADFGTKRAAWHEAAARFQAELTAAIAADAPLEPR